ncbi:GNAT family N-acetyltransferase [Acinetobacter indicus]|uniref:GNAT family N-acetyltransferase n=2 Tax=Acinetobacter indicus TaxID=756892 RepID=UPI002B1BD4D3|nr:GNAT family N-acetyltransferase [Acinetobacter indicus]
MQLFQHAMKMLDYRSDAIFFSAESRYSKFRWEDMIKMMVQHENNDSKGAFFVEANGERLAEMTYSRTGEDKIIIDHTTVSEQLRGQGVGRHLVEAAVNYAREQQIKIIPLCPYAKAAFEKDPSIQDVLQP